MDKRWYRKVGFETKPEKAQEGELDGKWDQRKYKGIIALWYLAVHHLPMVLHFCLLEIYHWIHWYNLASSICTLKGKNLLCCWILHVNCLKTERRNHIALSYAKLWNRCQIFLFPMVQLGFHLRFNIYICINIFPLSSNMLTPEYSFLEART